MRPVRLQVLSGEGMGANLGGNGAGHKLGDECKRTGDSKGRGDESEDDSDD